MFSMHKCVIFGLENDLVSHQIIIQTNTDLS